MGTMRYFKQFFLFGFILILSAGLAAQTVSMDDAVTVANNWHKHMTGRELSKNDIEELEIIDSQGDPIIYKFLLGDGKFIWVSADRRNAPVLAYNLEDDSYEGIIPEDYMYFQDLYKDEIIKNRATELKASVNHPDWSSAMSGNFKSIILENEVLPLMKVTWGQGGGYRQFTPDNTPTGCVAVAMVQIMRHWEYPDKGQGLCEYTHSVYGDFAVNFDTVDLIWDEMPLNEPNERIARLMFYAGIALHMNYAPAGSGANTEDTRDVLRDNFFYNDKRIFSSGRSTYGTVENWINMLKNELLNKRPIIVSGSGTAGHAFNFDGFRGDHFHVNWGWSGAENGYFLVTSLTPGSNNFSESQSCISGIFPGDTMMVDRPSSLRLLAGEKRVNLAWYGMYQRDLEYYKIYRDGVEIGKTEETLYTDTTVEPDRTYYYSVSSFYTIDSVDYESEQTPPIFCPEPRGIVLPYEEDFESGFNGWSFRSTATGFNWGTAKDLNMGNDEDSHFIGINSGVAGNKLVADTLVSNQVDLSNAELVKLSFDYILRQWQDIDHLYLMYRVFDDFEWITFHELETTRSYTNWTNYACYLPAEALQERVQLGFYYTDNGETGYGAGIDNIRIEVVTNPGMPKFSVSKTQACQGEELVFTDLSAGTKDSYQWDFGSGASPPYADSAGPHKVTYSSAGPKTVSLVLNGLDEKTEENFLEVFQAPRARFSSSINYKTVSFQNTSSDADAFMWDFGDGVKVTQKNPIHVYDLSGEYLVKLIAINFICGNDTIEKWVRITIAGDEKIDYDPSVNIFPNPSQGKIWINIENFSEEKLVMKVYSVDGKEISTDEMKILNQDSTIEKDFSYLESGLYFIMIQGRNINHISKFVIN
jgi:PKD repeat protein